ncbi:MAG: hypothetical protein Q8N23_07535 [Archangium sp.]|nr:hypothetical protein [Archangium sp.]MDP3152507.1 hypothetical protein [Archangium sp.]MDP3572323.1 hypothetical protein [Archangium sp.]
MRIVFPLTAILLLAGCPNYTPYLPDGGHAKVSCATTELGVPVTVLDRLGDPAPEAVVSIDYLSYAESENLIADVNGRAVIKEKYGPGTVRVQGVVNDLRTQIAELSFVGTECSSSVTPRALTLQLQ